MDNNYNLASMALFSKLYDNNRKDVYSLIFDFIVNAISTSANTKFSPPDISAYVNEYYGFNIPEAIYKTTLKRASEKDVFSYNKKDRIYIFDISVFKDNHKLLNQYELLKKEYDMVTEGLVNYVELRLKKDLSSQEKKSLIECFYNVLLGNNSNYLSALVSSYIIGLKKEEQEKLNSIREGIIIYEGVIFSPDLTTLGNWSDKITLFLSTEHLYHFWGLNGDVYKKIFLDFIKLINEVNHKERLIELKYFSETKDEIESFFARAENIVDNPKGMYPNMAMENLVKDCNYRSDIVAKKNKFYSFLTQNGIKEDNYDKYWIEENQSFNLLNDELINNVENDQALSNKDECLKILSQINKINILRKENPEKRFEKSKFLFISENRTTYELTKKDYFQSRGHGFYYAVNLDFIVNVLWFNLNKGFADKSILPTTFDVAIKSKLIFTGKLSQSIREKYNDLKSNNNLSKEEIANNVISLKRFNIVPEDLSEDIIEESLDFISTDIVEWGQRERVKLKKQADSGKSAQSKLIAIKEETFKKKRQKHEKMATLVYCSIAVVLYSFYVLFVLFCILLIFYGVYRYKTEGDTPLSLIFSALGVVGILGAIISKSLSFVKKGLAKSKKKLLKRYAKKIKTSLLDCIKEKKSFIDFL